MLLKLFVIFHANLESFLTFFLFVESFNSIKSGTYPRRRHTSEMSLNNVDINDGKLSLLYSSYINLSIPLVAVLFVLVSFVSVTLFCYICKNPHKIKCGIGTPD